MVSVTSIGIENRDALYELLDDEVPNADLGWGKPDVREKFRIAGVQLVGLGMTIDDAVDLLHTLYWAVASSFGA